VPTLAEPMLAMYREAAARVLEDALASELTSLTPGCEPEDMDSAVTEATPYLFIRNSQTKTEAEHARAVLASFAQRAFRRPVDASETDQLVATFVRAVNERGSYEEGMHAALMEILTSSHFLFRMEARADAAVEQTSRSSSESHARASRLSFFLWASAPDQELLRQADKGLNEESSSTQARRLLKDPRSQAFAHDFANHWLGLDRLKPSRPAEKNLVRAMRQETEHFFAAMVAEDRSVLEFLDADYTYLNEALANHYGIPGVQGEQLRRVALPEGQRGGLLTQGSLLTILSPHQESSPVLRGKWVLENLLGSAPIRPPASVVEAFQSAPRSLGQMPMRQLLEKHRTDPSCAACHARMDAIGLSLENFGPTGAWRTDVAGQAVDSNSDLPDGAVLNGPGGLKTYLLAHRREFVRALSERLLAYSLGRKLTDQDRASLEHVADRVAADDYRFSSVILQVVQSEPFQQGWRGVAVR
jgi:hypothetical protein